MRPGRFRSRDPFVARRAAQPKRLRAFVDLALEMLVDPSQHVLTRNELLTAGAAVARGKARRPV